jgi:hypothetical protein
LAPHVAQAELQVWTVTETLALLEQLGKAAEAEAIVKPLSESFFQWDKDPAAYETARAELTALVLSHLPRCRLGSVKTWA